MSQLRSRRKYLGCLFAALGGQFRIRSRQFAKVKNCMQAMHGGKLHRPSETAALNAVSAAVTTEEIRSMRVRLDTIPAARNTIVITAVITT